MIRSVPLAALVLLLALAPATSAAPKTRILTVKDSGKTVTLVPGQRLRIELEVCYSCGYHWETTRAPSKQVLTRQKQLQRGNGCAAPCAGGSATTIFRYLGRAAGRTSLRLSYIPPGSTKPAKRFNLTVRVR